MDYKDITCYDSNRNVVPLKSLQYREGYTLTDLFYAVKDASDFDDIIERVNKVICLVFVEEKRKENSILLKSGDIFLKVRLKTPLNM
ncbi:MAG: hypothetical protein K6F14_04725 [Clostridiales bacterium]|nr:hypothetical protein [Clostridiales bacterium]